MKRIPVKTPRRVASKIILLVVALELFSIVLWGALTYNGSRDELLKSRSEQLREIALSTTNEIGRFFLPVFIESEVISELLAGGATGSAVQPVILLNAFLNRRPEVEEVSLIDSEGKEVKRVSRMSGLGKDEVRVFNDDAVVQRALSGKRTIGSVMFTEYLEPAIRVATPMRSENGRIGAVLAIVNLKWLWDTVQSISVGKSGYVYVVDEALQLVAYPDPSLVLSGRDLSTSTVPAALFSQAESSMLSIYTSISGDVVAGVSHFDPVHRWWLVVEQPVDEALAPLDRLISRFILAFILATVLTVAAVVYFSRVMMRPLEELERAIDQLKQGGREVRVDVPENTELSSLSTSFNEMATNLDETSYKLHYQAYHDELTGLPNRVRLFETLESVLDKCNQSTRKPFALLLLDLDRFKEINDSLGHKCGDILLKELSKRLQGVLNEDELLARLGGDEFAIVLKNADSVDKARKVAERARQVIQEHFEMEGLRLLIDASVGIAMYPEHGTDSSTLMRHADIAMYHAKKAGVGVALYDDSYDIHSQKRLSLISGLPRAIKENELILHYQPKIRVSDRTVSSLEALIRWQHPEHGLLPPDQFIPIIELGDSIIELTNWVINRACLDCRKWQDQGISVDVAVNVSTLNIQDEQFIKRLDRILGEHHIHPGQLQLEITESVIMSDTKRAQKTIRALDSMGVGISIDDFGTGYSSLAYLKRIPVDELKIDKSFVMDMEQDDNDAVIVRSTIDLAHNLGLEVTAEGVETAGALDLLDVLGCNYAQGYYICRPVPADKIAPWIDTWSEENNDHVNIHTRANSERSS
ncbi:diguanylate cyclase (GGDEF)-like protein [Thiogranum longum]|uniref:cyclic-guanylate-specific phosphodiesterase n=1 Tax=Thiogranum longum TaxID=1537524 RepID=A0A4R1HMR5_9GAMM|nr:EAL domain-containing protein [Thiogranum longum]TCK18542.1 diguanylate cyclase (GGDEF)-like protein [Thiogranum longum]